MPSQEEYLDQLLRNIMNGGKGQPPEEEPAVEETTAETVQDAGEIYADGSAGEAQWPAGRDQVVPAVEEMPEGIPAAVELPGESDLDTRSVDMEEVQGMPEEAYGMFGSMPEEMPMAESMPEEVPLTESMSEEVPLTGSIPEEMPPEEESFMDPDLGDLSALMEELQGMPEEMPLPESMPEVTPMTENMSEEVPLTESMSEEVPLTESIPEETPPVEESFMDPDLGDLSALMEELQGASENMEDTTGASAGDDDIAELFKTFEDEPEAPVDNKESAETIPETFAETPQFDFLDEITEENAVDSPTAEDISSMSEDDIERLLAESREVSEDSSGSAEAFQGDVVDLLEGTKDGELQEIQDLLEKSDNNEAVDDKIESILKEAVQEDYQNSTGSRRSGTDADHEKEAEEQLPPRQQKAMEKKRLKEEKAAAKKAAREARKAEKAAKKAARKGGQNAEDIDTIDGAAAERSVDTAFLDSILSEAGKIDGAETISSATGNYDVKVDNIIPDEGEDTSTAQDGAEGSAFSASDDLGVDLANLFGGSSEAESAMLEDGDSDLAGFVALDGNEVNGVIELGGVDEEETKPKKKGFFSRFLEFLTEEEEEEEENEDIKLSEENQGIIEDLDKEKAQKDKKGKKGKKKAKKADASSEGGEEGEEGEEDKKGKKKKAKKPKKEKLPKEEEPVDPGKKLSLKKVLPIVLVCLSLGAVIIITVYGTANFIDRKTARNAYYEGDYRTCYQNLYGKDLNESEQVMFGKSECILRIRMWIREYEVLAAEGAGLEALDSLIQSVNDYPELYEYAGQCNAAGEVAQEYATILNLLYGNYGLTEDQARAIAAEPDDIEYTRQVNTIVQGGTYGSWNEPEPEVDVPLQDELPEETEMPEGNFIDTNAPVQ